MIELTFQVAMRIADSRQRPEARGPDGRAQGGRAIGEKRDAPDFGLNSPIAQRRANAGGFDPGDRLAQRLD
ncbi:hypothetical protein, partial [Salmonella enterica]|uniref:hypothetical protein n=1 Tax=Salmonella enterica TaxID=28901 RepID=UPI0020C348A8